MVECSGTFCNEGHLWDGRFVLKDVLYRRTFCSKVRFVEGHSVEGRFLEGLFVEGRFVEGRFAGRTFLRGRRSVAIRFVLAS